MCSAGQGCLVTLSRSEGSVCMSVEMLRCAQQDSAVTYTDAWTNLFICIIVPSADLSALRGCIDIRIIL